MNGLSFLFLLFLSFDFFFQGELGRVDEALQLSVTCDIDRFVPLSSFLSFVLQFCHYHRRHHAKKNDGTQDPQFFSYQQVRYLHPVCVAYQYLDYDDNDDNELE